MVYCLQCGHELPASTTKFCPSCGAVTTIVSAPSPTFSTPPTKSASHLRRNILVAIVILLVAIAAFGAGASSKSPTAGTQSVITVTAIQTATVVQTVSVVQSVAAQMTTTAGTQYDVVIRYTEKYSNQISYNQPKAGYTFLILTLQIQNNINREFEVNPFYFHVTINNVKYDVDFATYALSDTLTSGKVLKGGTLSGSIAFQVPEGTVNYTPSYEAFETVNVGWIHY